MSCIRLARWLAAIALLLASVLTVERVAVAGSPPDAAMTKRFEYLSKNGNSNCSEAFLESIAKMPIVERLRGSCCSPMNLERYAEQIEGLRKYQGIAAVPPDPYDVGAGLAQQALANYELTLQADEQKAYDYAMAHAEEHGPCCCQCWRWHTYGGLAKFLIHYRHFTGPQITEIWNLSDGCGGDA
jgi:hypothetical protein